MTDYLGGDSIAGPKMRSTSGWKAIHGGIRLGDGIFYYFGSIGHWWSSSGSSFNSAWIRSLGNEEKVYKSEYWKVCGFSVRCIKD